MKGGLLLLGAVMAVGCSVLRKPPGDLPELSNPALSRKLGWLLTYDVPLISVDSLAHAREIVIFDARESSEYAVSHLAGARRIEPGGPLPGWTDSMARTTPLAVYCSVGYRSENLVRTLRQAGFTRVSNLYGSIFEWVDRGYPVVDSTGRETDRLHTYSKSWGELVESPRIEKVYGP